MKDLTGINWGATWTGADFSDEIQAALAERAIRACDMKRNPDEALREAIMMLSVDTKGGMTNRDALMAQAGAVVMAYELLNGAEKEAFRLRLGL